MGYTHYWKNNAIESSDWKRIVEGVKKIANSSVALVEIEFGADYIKLNGVEGEDYEDFFLSAKPTGFEFCKTARRPYDEIVVAILMMVENIVPGFSWSSDGDPEDHQDGLNLLKLSGVLDE